MVIDVWMQHPTLRFLEQDIFASLRRWTGDEVPAKQPQLAVTVAAMDAANVDFGLLSAWTAPHRPPLISNQEVAGWVAEHASRFAGVAALDLNKPMEAVRELRRCVVELGFRGLRVVPWLWEAAPTDRRYYPLYATCVELGVPFFTQVGHTGPLRRRRKVLFGTNFPMIAHSQALEGLNDLGLDDEARELFLHGNAERLIKL